MQKIIASLLLVMVLSIVGCQTAYEEYNPRAMLDKYEWFKDASANLDRKLADIEVYKVRLNNLEEIYINVSRTEWQRADINNYNLWQSEVAGVIASYNQDAAEYNAQMAKFNWRFANAGTLPQGADVPLPREYKPYSYE